MNKYKLFFVSKNPWRFFSFVFLISNTIFPQTTDTFFCFEKPHRITFIDRIETLCTAGSLEGMSINENQRMESMMLYSKFLQKKGQNKEAITQAFCVLDKAIVSGSYKWQARIYLFLSKQYETIGSPNKVQEYLMKSFYASDKIIPKTLGNYFKALAYQEMAFFVMHSMKEHGMAITYLKRAVSFCALADSQKYIALQQTNYELLGKNYLFIGNYDEALSYFHKSEQLVGFLHKPPPDLQANLYLSIGTAYLRKKNYKIAKQYLMQALSFTGYLKEKHLLGGIYWNMATYYKLQQNEDQYLYFIKLYEKNAGNLEATYIHTNKQGTNIHIF